MNHSSFRIGEKIAPPSKNLLGFLRERDSTDNGSPTYLQFLPLTSLRGVAKAELELAEQSLKAEIGRKSQCVFSIDSYNGDLDKTKEAAWMYIWSKSTTKGDMGVDDEALFDLLSYGGDDGMQTEI